MDSESVLGKGIAFPPRLGPDGRWAWSQGEENVRQAMQVILLTNQGERLMLPDFGGDLVQFLFEPNTTTTRHLILGRIRKALAAWEPRLRVETITVEEDPADLQAAIATITYKLVATQASQQVSLRVTLTAS